jgi:hypothetical protein
MIMKCPRCGYKRQLRDNAYVPTSECPSCGIVYSKTISYDTYGQSGTPAPPTLNVKSPVHESSLQQARERVESRLRKRLETKFRDERHQQTLARAREIAAVELQKRMAEKQVHPHHPADAAVPGNGGKLIAAIESGIVRSGIVRNENPGEGNRSRWATKRSALLQKSANDTLSEASAEDTLAHQSADDTLAENLAANDTWPVYPNSKKPQPVPDSPSSNLVSITSASTADRAVTWKAPISHSEDQVPPETIVFDTCQKNASPEDSATGPDQVSQLLPESATAAALGHRAQVALGRGLMRVFSMVAWLILTAGVIGAILSWTTLTDVQAGVRSSITPEQGGLSLGLLLGFAYLATGVLGFAFFWVSSQISCQLKDIRRLLRAYPFIPSRKDA